MRNHQTKWFFIHFAFCIHSIITEDMITVITENIMRENGMLLELFFIFYFIAVRHNCQVLFLIILLITSGSPSTLLSFLPRPVPNITATPIITATTIFHFLLTFIFISIILHPLLLQSIHCNYMKILYYNQWKGIHVNGKRWNLYGLKITLINDISIGDNLHKLRNATNLT